jgi:hypothetical protein
MRKWTKEHAERGPLGKKEEGEESKTTTPARRGLRFALSPVPVAGGLVGWWALLLGRGGVEGPSPSLFPLLFLLFLGWLLSTANSSTVVREIGGFPRLVESGFCLAVQCLQQDQSLPTYCTTTYGPSYTEREGAPPILRQGQR